MIDKRLYFITPDGMVEEKERFIPGRLDLQEALQYPERWPIPTREGWCYVRRFGRHTVWLGWMPYNSRSVLRQWLEVLAGPNSAYVEAIGD